MKISDQTTVGDLAMEAEHERAVELLRDVRVITQGYVLPEWACATVRALYAGLERLEQEMHAHVHLENNVVFPRVVGLAAVTR